MMVEVSKGRMRKKANCLIGGNASRGGEFASAINDIDLL